MRLSALPGKFAQLTHLEIGLWPAFISEWLHRQTSGLVPCVLPGAKKMLRIPLKDFYDCYWFFSETTRGRKELQFFLDHVGLNDVVFDIGAFRGVYSFAVANRYGSSAAIHAFEPVPDNYSAVEKILDLNGFASVKVVPQPVGGGKTVKGLVSTADGMLRKDANPSDAHSVELNCVTIDDYVAKTGCAPSVLKIDVEGFELDVLEGGRECLQRHVPGIWLEMHPSSLRSLDRSWEEAIDLLRSVGYTTFDYFTDYYLSSRDLAFHVWCQK